MVNINFLQNDYTFKLNGKSHPRNFHAFVNGTKLRIVNAYDSSFQLLPYTDVTEFSVNNQSYSDVEVLLVELSEFLFLKEGVTINIGGGGSSNGYNILPTKYPSLAALQTAHPVANETEYTVAYHSDDSGRYWVKIGTTYLPVTPNGAVIPAILRTTSFVALQNMHDSTVNCDSTTNITCTLPANIKADTFFTVIPINNGMVAFEGATGVEIVTEDGFVVETRNKYAAVVARKLNATTWLVFGALKTA